MKGSGTIVISDGNKFYILIFILAIFILLLILYIIGRVYQTPKEYNN